MGILIYRQMYFISLNLRYFAKKEELIFLTEF